MRVVDAIAGELARAGIHRMYGMPGGGSNMALIGAAAEQGIEFVLMHHEPAAVFAAAGDAEVSGRPAVCLATLGPGVANSVNGLAHCLLDRVPLVLITDSPDDPSYLHQRLSHAGLVAGVVKRSRELAPDGAAAAVRAALEEAAQRPCGPIHLDLSSRVARAEAREADDGAARTSLPSARDGAPIDEAVDVLQRARRPVVLAGLGAAGPGVALPLLSLVERLGAPVLTTYKGKGVIPETHPQAAGLVTNGLLEGRVIDSADAFLCVGLDQVELMPGPWRWPHPTVTVGGSDADSTGHLPAAIELAGDPAERLLELAAALPDGWATDWRRGAIPNARPPAAEVTRRNGGGVAPADVVTAARRLAPRSTIATVDAGSHMFAATLFWEAEEPRRFLISNGLSTMGYGLPAAIGAALAAPDRRVVCFTGDGGLAMAAGELETAARLRLPLVVVVFNDSTLNLIKIKQEKRGETTLGLDFGAIDWVAVASGMGVEAERADDVGAFEAAFSRAIAAAGPRLVDVAIDASSYGRMLDVIRG